jgi:hypothetical protein
MVSRLCFGTISRPPETGFANARAGGSRAPTGHLIFEEQSLDTPAAERPADPEADDAASAARPDSTEINAHHGSAMPGRVADTSANIRRSPECRIMTLDIFEVDRTERGRRLL